MSLTTLVENAQLLGWSLVHFLWQGLLIALALEVVLRATPQLSAATRYLIRCGALLLMAIAPVATFLYLRSLTPDAAELALLVPTAALPATPAQAELWPLAVSAAWILGAAAFGTRLTRDYLRILRVRRANAGEALPAQWQERFDSLAGLLGVRAVARVVDSAALTVPTVIGWVRPVVLMPARVLTGLTPDQIEALLAHELAHVRRHDFLVNLFQSVIEAALFYHPAVWFVSKGIRAEREYCCDDIALAVTRDRFAYARALTTLEGWRGAELEPAMSTLGGSLMHRIQRMVGHKPTTPRAGSALVPLGALVLALVLGVTAHAAPQEGDGDELQELRARIVEMQTHLDQLRAKLELAEERLGKKHAQHDALIYDPSHPDAREDGTVVVEVSPDVKDGLLELRSNVFVHEDEDGDAPHGKHDGEHGKKRIHRIQVDGNTVFEIDADGGIHQLKSDGSNVYQLQSDDGNVFYFDANVDGDGKNLFFERGDKDAGKKKSGSKFFFKTDDGAFEGDAKNLFFESGDKGTDKKKSKRLFFKGDGDDSKNIFEFKSDGNVFELHGDGGKKLLEFKGAEGGKKIFEFKGGDGDVFILDTDDMKKHVHDALELHSKGMHDVWVEVHDRVQDAMNEARIFWSGDGERPSIFEVHGEDGKKHVIDALQSHDGLLELFHGDSGNVFFFDRDDEHDADDHHTYDVRVQRDSRPHMRTFRFGNRARDMHDAHRDRAHRIIERMKLRSGDDGNRFELLIPGLEGLHEKLEEALDGARFHEKDGHETRRIEVRGPHVEIRINGEKVDAENLHEAFEKMDGIFDLRIDVEREEHDAEPMEAHEAVLTEAAVKLV